MPADINSIAYAFRTQADVPWHSLGNPVTPGASIETWRKEANLGWKVLAPNVFFEIDGAKHEYHDKVLVRSDTKQVFDTVGRNYTPFQNDEILEFFREYVEAGDMQIETAGALGKGEVVWALAKMGEGFTLSDDTKSATQDAVLGYVLISNPHKYGKGATVKFTAVRVVCANTLAMALSGAGSSLQLPHSKAFDEGYRQDAKKRLGIAREKLHAFEEDARKLTKMTLTEEDVGEVLTAVFEEQERVIESVKDLYNGQGRGSLLPTSAGTGWGLLNAVTEYFDWQSGRSTDTRMKSAWYGAGASKKQVTLHELLTRAGS